MHKFSTQITSC